jgi:hypothetical protein
MRPEAHNSVQFASGLGASVASGPAPAPVWAIALAQSATLNHWAIWFEPYVTAPSSAKASVPAGASVRVWAIGADFSVGYRLGPLYGGTLLDAGLLFSQGGGVYNPKSSRDGLGAAGLRVAYLWDIAEHWALVPRADGLVALDRITMNLDGGEVFKSQRLLGRLGLTAEYQY